MTDPSQNGPWVGMTVQDQKLILGALHSLKGGFEVSFSVRLFDVSNLSSVINRYFSETIRFLCTFPPISFAARASLLLIPLCFMLEFACSFIAGRTRIRVRGRSISW